MDGGGAITCLWHFSTYVAYFWRGALAAETSDGFRDDPYKDMGEGVLEYHSEIHDEAEYKPGLGGADDLDVSVLSVDRDGQEENS